MRGLQSEANEHYVRAVGVTPELLLPLYAALRARNVSFLVAPYEADAQLAFMCRKGLIDFVITEDSDLIAYQCPMTVFKLDRDGNCEVLEFAALFKLEGLAGLSPGAFLEACVLAGCDYLPAIPRMGFRTAVKRMKAHRTADAVIGGLRREGRWEIPDGYEEKFEGACAIFLRQMVFDPDKGMTVGVHGECGAAEAGEGMRAEVAKGIAAGFIDPRTKEMYEVEEERGKAGRIAMVGAAVPPRGTSSPERVKFVPPSLRRFRPSVH
jgi:exonuclease-1